MEAVPDRSFRTREGGRGPVGLAVAGAAAVLGALILGAAAFVWSTLRVDCEGCPTPGSLASYRPPEAPHVYDRQGRLIAHLSGPVLIWTPIEDMPATLVDGLVAVEDRRFREHDGVDGVGVMRAALANLRANDVLEGASTLTMQLARILWQPRLGEMGRWQRKVAEVRLANLIEREADKERILELYLNTVYMGNGLHGAGAAARHYFGKQVWELTTGEIALLVGAIKTPERYDPRERPDRALARRAVVLDVMTREGVIDAETAAAARDEPIETTDERPLLQGRSYWAQAVDRELRRRIPDPNARRGVRVMTGLDMRLQAAAERSITGQVEAIEAGRFGAFRGPRPDSGLDASVSRSRYLQGAAVVMDARTGTVRALVGGRSFEHSLFDRAFLARRQPGSAFKPIVYAAALDRRVVSLGDRIDITPIVLRTSTGEAWQPRDHIDADEIGVRESLARSSNRAAVRIGERVGIEAIRRTAATLGIRSSIAPVPSSYLGASEVTPVELVAAYAALGNGGHRVEPHLITSIDDGAGRVVHRTRHERAAVLDERVAFLVRSAMRSVVEGGTGWRVRRAGIPVPVAGKTGTTNDGNDVWFVGTTPHLAAVAWFGFDEPAPILRNASGGVLAAPVWGELVAAAYEDGQLAERGHDWDAMPDGLVRLAVDAETGFAAREECRPLRVRTEWFLPGTEPEPCPAWEVRGPVISERGLRRLRGVLLRRNH